MKRNFASLHSVMKPYHYFFFALLVCLGTFQACKKDRFITDSSANISVSQDTILFDTVFTTIGSVTKNFRIYNNENENIRISSIELEGNSNSEYRMNVDGIAGDRFTDLELAPGDSMWVFVEVTIDPNAANLPFIVEDRIRIEVNTNETFVELVSWGQNAIFHGGQGGELFVLPANEVWNADLPHVIYGIVAVDEGNSLTINAGTEVYCHQGSGIYVFRGTLNVNGTCDNKVTFCGDRLEPEYQDLPGQWGIELTFEFESDLGVQEATVARGGIWLFENEGSTIDHAIIKNGNIGVQVDTLSNPSADALRITNTEIDNMSIYGLLCQGSNVSGANNLFSNCGQSCGAYSFGGRYQFEYCTYANYWSDGTRQTPSFFLNNYYLDVENNLQVRTLNDTWFYNCIMYGNNASLNEFSEFVVDIQDEDFQDYEFQYCGVDTEASVADGTRYNFMVNGVNPPFTNGGGGDFHLVNPTNQWNAGFVTGTFPPAQDINCAPRFLPGLKGCFEGQ
ncbi:MAG: hypothetical protein P8O05_01020 [Flavobacteriales bacterium]|nr:hypothetical protein [Flavobacteriales bacterium]MDG2244804.1 hypothetical protein [Flavobacteriales bacterium]